MITAQQARADVNNKIKQGLINEIQSLEIEVRKAVDLNYTRCSWMKPKHLAKFKIDVLIELLKSNGYDVENHADNLLIQW